MGSTAYALKPRGNMNYHWRRHLQNLGPPPFHRKAPTATAELRTLKPNSSISALHAIVPHAGLPSRGYSLREPAMTPARLVAQSERTHDNNHGRPTKTVPSATAVRNAWQEAQTNPTPHVLGRPTMHPQPAHPCSLQVANAAATFNRTPQPQVAAALRDGSFMGSVSQFIQNQKLHKWAAGTVKAKTVAVRVFLSFLDATGLTYLAAPPAGDSDEKPRSLKLQEEETLCAFAFMRVMTGQTPTGSLQYVSHIRQWYKFNWHFTLGFPGCYGKPSFTSESVQSLRPFFDDTDSTDTKRKPITKDILLMLTKYATAHHMHDLATAMVLAWVGLFRFGELTETADKPFGVQFGMAETHVTFVPSLENCRYVKVHCGPSKADQQGTRDKNHPRMLPYAKDELNAALWLQKHFLRRFKNKHPGTQPQHRRHVPLFMNTKGKPLQMASALTTIRQALVQAGINGQEYGTHSLRIGGFNHYFKMKVPIEIIKTIGGWSSDAWREYLRLQQSECMQYTEAMTKD